MLPSLRQRLLIAIATVVGAVCWLGALPFLRAPDLSQGLSVMDASAGVGPAVLSLAIYGLPAIIGALLVASSGSPVSGPFVLGVSLTAPAAMGGSIDGLFRRADTGHALGHLYPTLAAEMAGWCLALYALLLSIHLLRERLRAVLPGRLVSSDLPTRRWRSELSWPNGSAWLAGLVSAATGGLMSTVLIRSSSDGQVIGSLVLSFTIAGMLGRMLVNRPRVIAILLSPCLVGLAGYLWLWRTTPNPEQLLERYFAGEMLPLGLALPIQYASAGVAGAALGIGLGQGLLAGSHAARASSTGTGTPPAKTDHAEKAAP